MKGGVAVTNKKLLAIPPFIMAQDKAQVRWHKAQVRVIHNSVNSNNQQLMLIFPKGKIL